MKRFLSRAQMGASQALLIACVGIWMGIAPASPQATVSVLTARPTELYGEHARHEGKKWLVQLQAKACSYGLQHWGCYDASHAPYAIQQEGSIGMTSPGGGNWYRNGFFNFAIDDAQSRMYPVQAVRALDSGERASVEFLWDMPQAWARVQFMILADRLPLFCRIVQIPKTETVPKLRVRLVAYPAGYFHDGQRVIVTPTRQLKTGQQASLDPASEWAWIMYDERRDLGVEGSVGGAGGLTCPELVASIRLDVGSYGVAWEIEAKDKELRFAFWGTQELPNAALVPKLQAQFAPTLAELRKLDFTPRRLQPQGLAQLQAELDRLFTEIKAPETERSSCAQLLAQAKQLQSQLSGETVNLAAEEQLLSVLDKLEQLLWKVRMDWIFAD